MHAKLMILKTLATEIVYYQNTKILQYHLEELGKKIESKYQNEQITI